MPAPAEIGAQARDAKLQQLIERAQRESEEVERFVASSRRDRERAKRVLKQAGFLR